MKIWINSGRELSAKLQSVWRQLCSENRSYDSPFFDPAFTLAVAHARPDVKIAVIEQSGVPTGFFPFQERGRQRGEPVAYGISDMQGLICSRDLQLDLRRMLADCGLKNWRYDQLIDGHRHFLRYGWVKEASPYIDISTGFERYRIERRRAGSRLVDQALRKERKLQREQGELRFEFHDTAASAFDAMLRWKSAQRLRTHSRNVLDDAWVRDVLRRLVEIDTENFGGVLSTLYVKDELAAVHFGIRTSAVLHWWFPAYNVKFHHYSPGLVLLTVLIRESTARGIQRIDLGKGQEPYKHSMMTGITPVAEGGVGYGFIASRCGAVCAKARQGLRHPCVREQVMSFKRYFRRRLS